MSKKNKGIQHPDYVKEPMTRRQMLGRIATVGGIAGATGYLALAPTDAPLSMRDETGLLSVHKPKPFEIPDYRVAKPTKSTPDVGIGRGENPSANLRAALDGIGGLHHYIKPGDLVLIKPNVAFDRSPNLGATSNPKLLKELIHMILVDCRAQEVRVCDNPIESPPDCFKKSKIEEATVTAGGRVYLPDSNAFRVLRTPNAELIEEWWFFNRPFTNVDKVIGLAPIKDHNLCHASMGIKNWYGLLGGRRNQFHQNIHGIVSDLSIMIKPTLTVLDGSNVLMQNGPTGGDPSNVKKGDAVLACIDPIAGDAWSFEHLLERGRDYPQYLYKAMEKHNSPAHQKEGFIYALDWQGRVKEIHA